MNLETLLGSLVNTSIKINGLFVPANSLQGILHSFTDPALFHTDGLGDYHISKSGSLCRVKIQDRYFTLTSAHQFLSAGYEYNQLCLCDSDASLTTSHRTFFSRTDEDVEYDALLHEFTDVVNAGKLRTSRWLELSKSELSTPLPKPIKVVAIGYPGFRNTINYVERNYDIGPVAVYGNEILPSITERLAFSPDPVIDFDPSGMSGSPVFGLWTNNLLPEVFFAGILTNASRSKFHFLPRSKLGQLFEFAFDQ